MFWKYFTKSNLELIFKIGKTVFFENDGVQEVICWGAGRNSHHCNSNYMQLLMEKIKKKNVNKNL